MTRVGVSRGVARALAALAVAAVGAASCGGVQERLDLLRAKKIELVDDKDQTKLDVEVELRTLRDRIAKLEADLAAAKAAPPAASSTPPSAVPVTAPPDAGADAGKPGGRRPSGASTTSGDLINPF